MLSKLKNKRQVVSKANLFTNRLSKYGWPQFLNCYKVLRNCWKNINLAMLLMLHVLQIQLGF